MKKFDIVRVAGTDGLHVVRAVNGDHVRLAGDGSFYDLRLVTKVADRGRFKKWLTQIPMKNATSVSVGDIVTARDWGDMEEEFGLSGNSIGCAYGFTRDMETATRGLPMIVSSVGGDSITLAGFSRYTFHLDMLRQPETPIDLEYYIANEACDDFDFVADEAAPLDLNTVVTSASFVHDEHVIRAYAPREWQPRSSWRVMDWGTSV